MVLSPPSLRTKARNLSKYCSFCLYCTLWDFDAYWMFAHEKHAEASRNLLRLPAYNMMTSSNGNIFHITGLLWREFNGHWWIPQTNNQRLVTGSFDVFFDLLLKRQLNKQSRRRWFETPSSSLWRSINGMTILERIGLCSCYDMKMLSVLVALVRNIYRWPVDPSPKSPVMRLKTQ